ncbi:MAG: hypothetical protein AAFU85_19660 [Planctomycetota bacterium]
MTNPYEPIADATAGTEGTSASLSSRILRWRIVPATLNWLMGVLLLVSFISWVVQAFGANAEYPFDLPMWTFSIGVSLALGVSSILNFVAGFRWIKRRWISAVVMNVISWILLYVAANRMQAFMDAH